MGREIVLDTETTGIDPQKGHRLIEIGCVELEDLLPTGRTLHLYFNPEREIEPEAERVHGISNAFVADKPKFREQCQQIIDFIGDAPLIAHNASFDRGFINNELKLSGKSIIPEDRWIDTLKLAQKKFPGAPNNLDALCRRFKISLDGRDKHGGLIDSQLLALVYLELMGGKERGLDLGVKSGSGLNLDNRSQKKRNHPQRPNPLGPLITQEENAAHEAFVHGTLKEKAVWLTTGLLDRPQREP